MDYGQVYANEERQAVLSLIYRYSTDSDDTLKLWPADKQYHFSDERQSALAYTTYRSTAIAHGDPVGETSEVEKIIDQFTQQCIRRRVIPIFIQATDTWSHTYKVHGYKRIYIGADAQIDTAHFTLHTARNKHFRNVRNRFEKKHYSVHCYTPPHSEALLQQLQQISDAWLALPRHREFRFIAGNFDISYLQSCTIHVLEDIHGEPIAFANLLIPTKDQEITVDLMRFTPNVYRGAMDFLFMEIIRTSYEAGIRSFNLGFTPPCKYNKAESAEGWLMLAYKLGGRLISFEGLARYKAKFEPIWRERYVYYRARPWQVPRIAQALFVVTRYK